jgi:hypothetical protein
MKHTRITAGQTWTEYKTNTQIVKELKITQILDKLPEYKRNWIQRMNRMPRNRLPSVIKHCCLTGRRNHGRHLKRFLDTCVRNGSTRGPTAWHIHYMLMIMRIKQWKVYFEHQKADETVAEELHKFFFFSRMYCEGKIKGNENGCPCRFVISSGVLRNIFRGWFNKFSSGQGAERMEIWGRSPLVRGSAQFANEWNLYSDWVVTDVFSTELGIRLGFVKTSEFRGGGGV